MKKTTEVRDMPGSVGSEIQKVKFTTILHEPSDGSWDEFMAKMWEMKPKTARVEGVTGGFVIIEKMGSK